MFQKRCRLARADKSWFGGGSVDIPQRSAPNEFRDVFRFGGQNIDKYNQFANRNQLLRLMNQGAGDLFRAEPSPLLSAMQTQGLDYLQGDQSPLLQGLNQRAMTPSALLTNLNQQAMNQSPSSLLAQMQGQAGRELATEGRLTPEQAREAEQASLALSAGAGMAGGTQGLAAALLNRDKYSNERLRQYQQYAQGVEGLGQSQMAEAHRFGLGTEAANQAQNQFGMGVQGLNLADIQSRFGVAKDVQGMTQLAEAQKYAIPQSVLSSGVGAYTGLTNPVYNYLSDLFSSNQNASAAQSVAGANKSAGATSGVAGILGSVATAAGIAL